MGECALRQLPAQVHYFARSLRRLTTFFAITPSRHFLPRFPWQLRTVAETASAAAKRCLRTVHSDIADFKSEIHVEIIPLLGGEI